MASSDSEATVYPIPSSLNLEDRFTYHAPFGDQPERYNRIRDKAKELAYLIASLTPMSREQSTSLTHLDGCVMFANAAIARNEKPE
jgi:hypothetical protein